MENSIPFCLEILYNEFNGVYNCAHYRFSVSKLKV